MDTPTQGEGQEVGTSMQGRAGSGYTHSGEGQEVDTPTQGWQEVDTPISGCVVQRREIRRAVSTPTHSGEGMNWPAHAREGHEVDTPMQSRGMKWIHPFKGVESGHTHSGRWRK